MSDLSFLNTEAGAEVRELIHRRILQTLSSTTPAVRILMEQGGVPAKTVELCIFTAFSLSLAEISGQVSGLIVREDRRDEAAATLSGLLRQSMDAGHAAMTAAPATESKWGRPN
jgi:hypothetical protein